MTDYAEIVMDKIADFLFKERIAHDTGDNCVYFNDPKAKKTFCVTITECPEYEGD